MGWVISALPASILPAPYPFSGLYSDKEQLQFFQSPPITVKNTNSVKSDRRRTTSSGRWLCDDRSGAKKLEPSSHGVARLRKKRHPLDVSLSLRER